MVTSEFEAPFHCGVQKLWSYSAARVRARDNASAIDALQLLPTGFVTQVMGDMYGFY